MVSKKKTNKVPATVVSWYNKLYLERKGSTKTKFPNKLLEATKSWVSLNEAEKKYFSMKFEECRMKYNEKFLTCLQKAEPFMKEKVLGVCGKNDSNTVISNQDNYLDSHIAEENNQQEDTEYVLIDLNNEDMPEESELLSHQEDAEYGLSHSNNEECEQNTERYNRDPSETLEGHGICNNSQGDIRLILSEPTPPNVKTGKEFFEMVRFMGEKNNSAWTSLSQIERNRYTQAVISLKKDYIQKYTSYLENLSQRDLFDHYNKILN